MIRVSGLTLRRGTRVLLDRADLLLPTKERVGLTGANGAGKSSLFALFTGALSPDAGEVTWPATWRLSAVAQELGPLDDPAVQFVMAGDVEVTAVSAHIARLEATAAPDGHLLGELHGRLEELGGYTLRARAETLLLGLGFKLTEIDRPVASFSGGWRMRLALARSLMAPSDLLLLDEPTNHLDLDAIIWLEQWLKRYEGVLLVISHDREFLDGICECIVHIENQKLERYTGNYSRFEDMRAERLTQNRALYARQQDEIARLERFITRFRAKPTKARQAQSRAKTLEKIERIVLAHVDTPLSIRFEEPDSAPDPMLTLEGVACGYPGAGAPVTVLRDVDWVVRKGERVGLLGANGQGKSTLVKTLAGVLAPLAGSRRAASGLSIGYFAQHQVETLRMDDSPLAHLVRLAPLQREQELRDFLGRFDFSGERVHAPVGPFSGGEKARLALALIIWQKPNLLLLDEPTNHLDLDTRTALMAALAQFEGTVIVVAHDRALLRATADTLLVVHDGKVAPFEGDLDDYRDWLLGRTGPEAGSAPGAPGARTAPAPRGNPAASAPGRDASARERRRQEAAAREAHAGQRRPLEARVKRIEEQLEKLNAARRALEDRLAQPDAYAAGGPIRDLLIEQAYLQREIAQLEEEWLSQQTALEALAAQR